MAEKTIKVIAQRDAVGSPEVKKGDTIEIEARYLELLVEAGSVKEQEAPKRKAPEKKTEEK